MHYYNYHHQLGAPSSIPGSNQESSLNTGPSNPGDGGQNRIMLPPRPTTAQYTPRSPSNPGPFITNPSLLFPADPRTPTTSSHLPTHAPTATSQPLPHTNHQANPGRQSRDASPFPQTGHKCPHCPTTAASKSTLDHHIGIHHGPRPHACPRPGCPRTFAYAYLVREHLLGDHGDAQLRRQWQAQRARFVGYLGNDELHERFIQGQLEAGAVAAAAAAAAAAKVARGGR
ncbi:hypothetical protein MBLNU459_g7838t1 [Dothideomycetes sp. NU459]